jgi:ubiquinone/menaquinone biosynthesis C-methylase UbiE
MNARAAEVEKYVSAYRDGDYRMGHTRKRDVIRILQGLSPKTSILDVGTGRGETLTLAKCEGFQEYRGTEVVPYLLKPPVIVFSEAHDLQYPDGAFEHVTCFDVLEHLLEDDIVPALQEMKRVARTSVTVSACPRSHRYKGVELHISARPMEDWHELITGAWEGGVRNGNAGVHSGMWQLVKHAD